MHGFEFMRERMWDRRHGGFFWELDGGEASDPRKHAYGQAFGLLALTELARTAELEPARELRDELFELVERHARDERYGGYVESLLPDWSPEPAGRTTPLGLPAGDKSVNTHMHLISALAALVEADPAGGPRQSLRELISIVFERAVSPLGCPEHHRRDWTPVPGWRVSYGHDLEAVWLSMRACRVARTSDAALLGSWQALWDAALEHGFDHERGVVYESGPPGRPADKLDKVWWIQAEALVGALRMHERTGEPRYRQAFVRILDWIARGQADWERGDWYGRIAPDGRARGDKAGTWECPFHQGRALLECLAEPPSA